MGLDRRVGPPVPFVSTALAIFCVIYAVFIPTCTGQLAQVVEPFGERLVPPENQKVEDELVDEAVAEERLWAARNRAFGAGYLAMAPKILCAGGQEKVFITFVNFTQPIEVMFAVMEDEDLALATTPVQTFYTPCGCVELDLPPIDSPRMVVTLYMYAKRSLMQCDEFEVMEGIKVYLDACNSETFIETDKPIYKPGQQVQFRVLTLLADLRPDLSVVPKIWMESPSGVHMAQWLEMGTDDGLIDLSMPMSTDPPMGEWKIKVLHHDREFVKTFQVGEYVLPKFEVTIDGLEYVVAPGGISPILVCGRYTHGQPVRGSIRLHVYVSRYPANEITDFIPMTDNYGCHLFLIDVSKINFEKLGFINWSSDKLVIKAEFEEAATRVVIEKTVDDIVISRQPFKLEFSVLSTFKPGLPFSGMLLFNDPSGKPLPGEMAEVTARGDHGEVLREFVMGNDRGIAFFTIHDVPQDTEYLSLQASITTSSELGSTPRAYAHVKPQFSPSKSFIHINPITETAEVGSYQTLTIHMTSEKPEYNGVYLHTVIMSRGNILLSVDMIIPPEEIDAFRQPGRYGVYPVRTDEMGMKEYVRSLNMRSTDIPIHILEKGKIKTTRRKFKISYEMPPTVTVMVYYVRDDGEVVADTVTVAVEEVFQNKVVVDFAESEKQPGENTTLNIYAKPMSLCAYGVVDKSVHLLGGGNRITKEKVFKALGDLQLSSEGGFAEPHSKRCHGSGGYGGRGMFGGIAPYPYPSPSPDFMDASQSFKDLGVVYLSNLQVETAPCPESYPPIFFREDQMADGVQVPVAMPMVAMAENMAMVQSVVASAPVEDSTPDVRSYFPETWLYDLVRISYDGRADIPIQVPHTITEWIGHGFCTSTKFGAGVSDLTKLRAFQPFFIDMTLWYSVIRNEQVPVTVVVFNYVTKCLVVELNLQPSSDFEIEEQNRQESVCVCGGESRPATFYITPVTIGNIQIEVHAVSVPDVSNRCGNREMDTRQVGFSDGIRKDLLVKPEGVETEQVFSVYVCPNDYGGTFEDVVDLGDLPGNYVSGSERGIVTVTGDMLGPTIDNLDHLLRIPTGCGEQNMIGFVPNIFVMHYLTGINQLSPAIVAKATAHMEIGYQRELNYRHADGSYSAFGERDDSGSTWLTAFVVRSFAQAGHYIFIDPEDLDKSTNWLMNQQRQLDGCFESRGRVIHKDMMGRVNDATTLTAYVVISLIEAGVPPEEESIQKAIDCLHDGIDIDSADMYTLALAGYAFILAGYPHRDDVLARLNQLAVESEDGLKHWEGRPEPVPDNHPPYLHHQASSQHIEITSYVLLTYIRAYDKTQALVLGNPVARWIIGQRNANGGFASTQDTVMALQALAEYGLMAYVGDTLNIELQVKFSSEDSSHWLYIREHNRLLLQTLAVPQVPVQIDMTATGSGCAMAQVIMTYNVYPETPAEPPFSITFHHEESRDNNPDPCSAFNMRVCAKYNGEDEFSNMAVIQVRMVSGFEADVNNIGMLRARSSLPRSPKRIDEEGNDVFFYFDQLDHEDTCVQFTVRRDAFVMEPRDGVITVFDYYEKALSSSQLYNFVCQGVA